MCIRDRHIAYAEKINMKLSEQGIRVEMDTGDDTIGKKLRTHRAMRPAYLLILGDEEASNSTVSYLGPGRQKINGVDVQQFIDELVNEIQTKT